MPFKKISEEKVRGKGLEEVWSDENGWNETVVWRTEMKGRGDWRSVLNGKTIQRIDAIFIIQINLEKKN